LKEDSSESKKKQANEKIDINKNKSDDKIGNIKNVNQYLNVYMNIFYKYINYGMYIYHLIIFSLLFHPFYRIL